MTTSVWREMTPACVRERRGSDHADVAFLESAPFVQAIQVSSEVC